MTDGLEWRERWNALVAKVDQETLMTEERRMTPEQSARERAQEQANATGKSWAVGRWTGAHEWDEGRCAGSGHCQRIDPAPAPSEGEAVECDHSGWNEHDLGFRGRRFVCSKCDAEWTLKWPDIRARFTSKTAASPAPLARDMTLRQRLAVEIAGALLRYATPDAREIYAGLVWSYADAVLAAEGRKP